MFCVQSVRVSGLLVRAGPQLPARVLRAPAQPGLSLHHGDGQLLLHLALPRLLHLPPQIQRHRSPKENYKEIKDCYVP